MKRDKPKWGLWNKQKRKWQRSAWTGLALAFDTLNAAQKHKTSVTNGKRSDPLLAFYRINVVPKRFKSNP